MDLHSNGDHLIELAELYLSVSLSAFDPRSERITTDF